MQRIGRRRVVNPQLLRRHLQRHELRQLGSVAARVLHDFRYTCNIVKKGAFINSTRVPYQKAYKRALTTGISRLLVERSKLWHFIKLSLTIGVH